ncbi:hypothetical protein JCM14467A_09300 [Vulcanisaeta sp. JCM 14467]
MRNTFNEVKRPNGVKEFNEIMNLIGISFSIKVLAHYCTGNDEERRAYRIFMGRYMS